MKDGAEALIGQCRRFPETGPSQTLSSYQNCRLCPRSCGVDRTAGKRGVCGVSDEIYLGRAALHFWEEPCISGTEGSGAVFFSGCTLKCVFCQNYELSHSEQGKRVSIEGLSDIFLALEQQGANNINLVTPDHYLPSVVMAMEQARNRGLRIPYVINCSGYETEAQIRLLDGLADIYLDDFKFMDSARAKKYVGAADYPERAKEALREMHRQQPLPVFDASGKMQKGIIVRHLLMPGMVRNGKAVVEYLYETYGDSVYLSLMHQFTPFPRLAQDYPELNRTVTSREYRRFVDYALSLGVKNAFIQEETAAKESFVPVFDGTNPLGSEEVCIRQTS